MFIIQLKSSDLTSLAPYRHLENWEIGMASDETCYLRAPDDAETSEKLILIPALKRWTLAAGNKLIPLGKQLPDTLLPDLPWLPLANLLPLTSTRVLENEAFFGHLGFSLIKSSVIRAPSALLLPFKLFAHWAETAPAPRLDRLQFALSDSGQALIVGTPLPPLSGQTFYQDHNLLTPSGYTLPNYILPQDLTHQSDLTLIDQDNIIFQISHELFIPASRSAIRATANAL